MSVVFDIVLIWLMVAIFILAIVGAVEVANAARTRMQDNRRGAMDVATVLSEPPTAPSSASDEVTPVKKPRRKTVRKKVTE